jgi:hypothetical protein
MSAENNMNNENEAVIKKIRKLLSLATSPNEHEAQVAAAKAQELLVRHNLTLQHIERKIEDYQPATFYEGGKRHPVLGLIIPLLEKFFFVRIVQIRDRTTGKYGFGTGKKRGSTTRFEMIGTEVNVKIAQYVADFLLEKFKLFWKNYQKETGCGIDQRTAYWWGIRKGLEEQLQAKREKVENEMGLVVVEDPGLQTAMTARHGKLTLSSTAGKIRSNEALEAGREVGRNLQINRGIEEQNKGRTFLLGGKK